jgi:hypothetical protein
MAKKTTNTPAKRRIKKSNVAVFQTSADLRSAILIVSLIANLFVLCLWMVLQLTDEYDQALIEFFINR